MFDKTSKAGVGLIAVAIYVVMWIGGRYGLTITESDATDFVMKSVGVIGLVITYWGQLDRKDLKGGLTRL